MDIKYKVNSDAASRTTEAARLLWWSVQKHQDHKQIWPDVIYTLSVRPPHTGCLAATASV